ncbi:MAG: vitamin K epoxide reductase family protein [Anaerolineae bacterium]|nr:vitamin K epoxide reductase family protein [Anaerolineae bacterium]
MATKQATLEVRASSLGTWLNWRTLSIALLIAAIGVSGYLTYVKATNVQMECVSSGTFNCGVVQNSVYSELMGVPIAYFGLGLNLVLVGLLVLEPRIPALQEFGFLLYFGGLLFGTIFSVYLVYVQAAILEAYCPWCLTHEAIYFTLFPIALWRAWRYFGAGATAN